MNCCRLLLAAAAVCTIVRFGLWSAECPGADSPLRGRAFIFNQDCNDVNSWATRGRAQETIRDWYRRALGAGAAVLVADVALPDVVEIKDCPSGELIGARFPEAQRKEIRHYQTVSELMAQGTDVLHLACEEARKAGAMILGGARMSDAHHGSRWQARSDNPLFPKIILEHPEWCNTWPDGRIDATLNYAIPQVQSHRLRILQEMAANYSLGSLYWDRKGNRKLVAARSLDQFRATAANWYAWGASGGSCFNMYLWPAKDQDFYARAIATLSAPAKALAGPRHYVYLPAWKDVKNFDPTGRHYAQSLTFDARSVGKRQVFKFRMADGRNGEKLAGLLRFRICDATPDDQFAVVLNGRPIPAERLSVQHQPQGEVLEEPLGSVPRPGEPFFWPAGLRCDVSLADCPPLKGDNELGITLMKQNRAAKGTPVMEALEVWVR